jgi:dipeptidyl aminopeptidase/acylaminoacyl peptidase
VCSLLCALQEVYFPEWEFGVPWGQPEGGGESQYDKWNPESSVQHWKTPTLVIQGGKDFRVVETEVCTG